MEKDLAGRTFLVTGANTGIGKATAHGLAERGARLILANRSEAKTTPVIDELATATGNDAVEYLHLDLADLASVKAAADTLVERGERLDVLVDNAGVAGQRGLTAQGFELAFGINHLGHFLFTTELLNRLGDGAPGRVVVVSSESHYSAKGIDWEALRRPTATTTGLREYGVSKLCNVLFAQELARRFGDDGLEACSLHPGVIASDVWRRVPWPVRSVMKLFMRSTEDGAVTSLHCATTEHLEGPNGSFYDKCRPKDVNPVATPELAKELWERSEEWVADFR